MGRLDWESETLIPTSQGGFPSPDTIAFSCKDHAADAGEVSPTLRSMGHANSHPNAGGQVAVAFQQNQLGEIRTSEISGTINTNSNASGRNTPMAQLEMSVRRLTPKECERLQGFPDNHTRIPLKLYPKKKVTKVRSEDRWEQMPDGQWALMSADGPRYKAIGNSMAVPCMRWIGRRIKKTAASFAVEDWS